MELQDGEELVMRLEKLLPSWAVLAQNEKRVL